MKKFVILFVFLSTVSFVNGQSGSLKDVGDTIGPMTIISFEQPTPYVSILPLSQNLWQIGAPHKTIFNAAYTLPNVIITDTINNYPVNNLSSFELIVGQFNSPRYPMDIFIDFRHRYNTDTLQDGGYITISWDEGLTWNNILDDSANFFFASPHHPWYFWGNTNLYGSNSLLYNGEHGFSGNSSGWVHSCMAWYDLPVKNSTKMVLDTMRLRFNFISDGIQNNREGWMIDEIRLYAIDLGSGIREYLKGDLHSWFYPNPVSTTATFTLTKTSQNVHYELVDNKGELISKGDRGTCDEFTFDRSGIAPGIYFMRLYIDNKFVDNHKIIITQE